MHANIITDSLRAFMHALIDYAGLFPPAKLPLDEAINNYARYRLEPDRWMLSRFIIPTTQLGELTHIAHDKFHADDPFVFSALGRGGTATDEFFAGLRTDLQAITEFRRENGAGVVVDVFEVKISDASALDWAADLLAETGGLTPFYEVPFGSGWEIGMVSMVDAIARHNTNHPTTKIGFKLRCGGVEPSAFPAPAQIALALTLCRDARIPLKATAGLHHPVRRYREEVQTKMHGFLNVFGAGLLAYTHPLTLSDVQAIIEDESADHFRFENEIFYWQSLGISTETITKLRKSKLISFGSCSFDEPHDDLRQLNLL